MKRHNVTRWVVGGILLAVAGCGDGTDDSGVDAGGTVDAAPGPEDAGADGFATLISRSWTIPAGSEIYRCTRVTLPEDVYVSSFRALAPLGTHHTVLSMRDNPTQPDGDYDCGAGTLAHTMVYASGVGTDDLSFPEGVAIELPAGRQLDLNLHLYNVSDTEITGTSGTLIQALPAAQVQQEAEVVFGGDFNISLPPDPQTETTVYGGCTFAEDATVVALWPHMHQLGRHIRVVHEAGGGDVTLLDAPYDFNEQLNVVLDPVQVRAGERLGIDCTYVNDTGDTVGFGDSSEQEMCFAGIYRYPATGAGVFDCVEFDG